jgi:hypothetical protein
MATILSSSSIPRSKCRVMYERYIQVQAKMTCLYNVDCRFIKRFHTDLFARKKGPFSFPGRSTPVIGMTLDDEHSSSDYDVLKNPTHSDDVSLPKNPSLFEKLLHFLHTHITLACFIFSILGGFMGGYIQDIPDDDPDSK